VSGGALLLGFLAPELHGLEPVGRGLLGLRRLHLLADASAGVARAVVLIGGGQREAGLERHELLEHGAVVADRLLAADAIQLTLHPLNSCTNGNTNEHMRYRTEPRESGDLAEPKRALRARFNVRTLRDEVEAEGQLALEDLDLEALLLQREQVLAAAAPVAGGGGRMNGKLRGRVHLHYQNRARLAIVLHAPRQRGGERV
jgi:hypothetical protein